MEDKRKKKRLCTAMYIIGAVLAWGGILYAIGEASRLRWIGFVVSLIGYAGFFSAAWMGETADDRHDV